MGRRQSFFRLPIVLIWVIFPEQLRRLGQISSAQTWDTDQSPNIDIGGISEKYLKIHAVKKSQPHGIQPHGKFSTDTSVHMSRMVFTHIGKSGGSYFINLMEALAKKNGFTVDKGARIHGFRPSKEVLSPYLNSMENISVYVNHANYILGLDDPGYQWASIMREPVDLMGSLFYYAVDTQIRKAKAINEVARRKEAGVCGCANLEFDNCVHTMYEKNCSMELPSQIKYFCEPHDQNCSGEVALRHVMDYNLVGLTEEMGLTLKLLEKRIPWVFTGYENELHVSKRETNLFNQVTHTIGNGAVSKLARKQLAERASNYKEETQFYEQVKRLFWKRAVEANFVRRR